MTFFLRGAAISFSAAVIIYGTVSLLISLGWRVVHADGVRYFPELADLLFALRLAPAVISAAVMLIFAVPSFLWLEPRAVIEPIGMAAILLCASGLTGMLCGIWKAARSLRIALRTVAIWAKTASAICSDRLSSNHSVRILQSSSALPPLTAAGILKPTVWLSQTAESVLNARELRGAMRHEMVHVRHKDNLRKLLFHLIAFPGMEKLESAWREATEMAADDAAVSNPSEALDLAAALIKLSRIAPLRPPAELTTALVHSPISSVNARVERLIHWDDMRGKQPGIYFFHYLPFAVAGSLGVLGLSYTHLLIWVHAATELLVR
jgi:beta-lactamase regulating signal transducer with metallopeptidase domain